MGPTRSVHERGATTVTASAGVWATVLAVRVATSGFAPTGVPDGQRRSGKDRGLEMAGMEAFVGASRYERSGGRCTDGDG